MALVKNSNWEQNRSQSSLAEDRLESIYLRVYRLLNLLADSLVNGGPGPYPDTVKISREAAGSILGESYDNIRAAITGRPESAIWEHGTEWVMSSGL